MLEESLRNFKEQLTWEPKVENQSVLRAYGQIILCGMGGSRLAAGFLKMIRPDLNIRIHNDYGLPPGYYRDSLVIVVSYSGNTEEAIGNFHAARTEGLLTAAVTSGGDLLELARKEGMPWVQIPPDFHPRMATGYILRSLLTILGDLPNKNALAAVSLESNLLENAAQPLAQDFLNRIPSIYSSRSNGYLAEHWKIALNENAKTPAFWNVLPELAHNELAGIHKDMPAAFILLRDSMDHPRIQIKMGILENLLKENGLPVQSVSLPPDTFQKIFTSYLLANWVSLHLAKLTGVNPDEVSAIENFKRSLKDQ